MKKKQFSEKVEEFLRNTGMSATAFGEKSKGEPNFVFWLRKGRECREETQERVLNFMKNYEKEYEKEAGSAAKTC